MFTTPADRRWKDLDEDLDTILERAFKGDVIKKLSLFTKIVYEEWKEQFGRKDQTGNNFTTTCVSQVAAADKGRGTPEEVAKEEEVQTCLLCLPLCIYFKPAWETQKWKTTMLAGGN